MEREILSEAGLRLVCRRNPNVVLTSFELSQKSIAIGSGLALFRLCLSNANLKSELRVLELRLFLCYIAYMHALSEL